MHTSNVTIQFASHNNLWAFRQEIQLNAFYMNFSKMTITFELPNEEIGWAIEKHYGQIVNERQTA